MTKDYQVIYDGNKIASTNSNSPPTQTYTITDSGIQGYPDVAASNADVAMGSLTVGEMKQSVLIHRKTGAVSVINETALPDGKKSLEDIDGTCERHEGL